MYPANIHRGSLQPDWVGSACYFFCSALLWPICFGNFMLWTDHKPLVKNYSRHKSLSKTVASRLQQWAISLTKISSTFGLRLCSCGVSFTCIISFIKFCCTISQKLRVCLPMWSTQFALPVQACDVKSGKSHKKIHLWCLTLLITFTNSQHALSRLSAGSHCWAQLFTSTSVSLTATTRAPQHTSWYILVRSWYIML